MTREEANKELERAFDVLDHTCHMDNRRKEAFNMARVALSAEPCDCISRQAVLETVNSRIAQIRKDADAINESYSHLSFAEGVHDGYCRLKCDLRILPSVTPKPKTDVLDKIKAEIVQMPTISFNANDIYKADILAIIDKYKSEGKK